MQRPNRRLLHLQLAAFLVAFLTIAGPALARPRTPALTPAQRAEVRQQIRSRAEWQFALLEGRRPVLRTTIRPVPNTTNRFTAKAEILAIWRGARAALAENEFSIIRRPDGRVTVTSPQPFLPR